MLCDGVCCVFLMMMMMMMDGSDVLLKILLRFGGIVLGGLYLICGMLDVMRVGILVELGEGRKRVIYCLKWMVDEILNVG